jgi:Tfp pilus tip-associated adhesin PilY1
MRTTSQTWSLATRALCAVVAFTMTFSPLAAFAAPTPLSDIPIAAKVSAKPNIVYTLDDSGSMQYNYLPDYAVNSAGNVNVGVVRILAVTPPPSGTVYRARATAAGLASVSVGDWVNIIGAAQPEYNGFVKVEHKNTATSIDYNIPGMPATPATIAINYPAIQVVTSAAYCRSGAAAGPCAAQAMNVNSVGTTYAATSITRPGPISNGGLVTATATGTAANFANLNTGDIVLITNSTTGVTKPGTSSDPYYGYFVITKISSTQFTYQITAVANITPLSAGGARLIGDSGAANFAAPPMHAADFNRLAYNPLVTYNAPKKANGLPLTNTGTDANGNYASTLGLWTSASVDRDPFGSYEAVKMWPTNPKDDLSIKVGVPLYCNTDWPILVNEPNGPATARDAGDVNGQYMPGSGAYCRINGTRYDASATSGAPAANADYNYPWQSSNGTNGPEFFYRVLTTKRLWCDSTSPWWPRSGTILSCNGGTATTTTGPPVPQTCVTRAKICNPTVASRTYIPPACKTDPPAMYCLPNIGGSDGNSLGTGTLPECLACDCNADTNPTPPKWCSITNAACNVNSDCPDQPGATTITSCVTGNPVYQKVSSPSCTSLMFDPYTNANKAPSKTLLQDANDPNGGVVCRHNNLAYTQTGLPSAGGLFTYSRTNAGDVFAANKAGGTTPKGYALAQTGAFTTPVDNSCPAVGPTVQIPRHYYVIDWVQFCDNRDFTVNGQWRGFGAGTCQAANDLQRFKEVKYGQFLRVDLFPSNSAAFPGFAANPDFPPSPTPYPGGRQFLAGATPGPDNSEAINYANWYAYYSTRLLAAKSTSATAFSFLTPLAGEQPAYRVGFHNLGEEPVGFGGAGTPIVWLDVRDWDPTTVVSAGKTQIELWYEKLFGISVSTFKTPTLGAMLRVGNLFETGGAGGLPASINPLPATATEPLSVKPDTTLVSCQNNYHILFTDGKTNQVTGITTPGDQDGIVPASLSMAGGNPIQPIPPDQVLATLAPLAGSAWPNMFKQGVTVSNTLADVAAYYWSRDLRPTLKNDVPSITSKMSAGVSNDGDARVPGDVAWWQHVNFNAISFGAEGTLDAVNQTATLTALGTGTKTWPDLTQPFNPINPKGAAQGAVAVDDLWHATVMSRGSFVFARSPIEVSYGLSNILAGIQNQRKTRVGATFGGQVLDPTNNVLFQATIEPGWAGDLLKVEVDPVTGTEVATLWQAAVTLRDQIDPVLTGCPVAPAPCEPWMDPTHRRIVTSSGGAGVPFQFANLSAAQLTSLAPTATQQKKVISYLRGGKTWTDTLTGTTYTIEGTGIGQFRKRFGILGDLSNAQPVVVFNPARAYQDSTDPGYSGYKAANAARSPRIVAPANDGMVHVFDTGPMRPAGPGGGTEIFAFMPGALFKGANHPAGIQALTYQDGGVPIYRHHMYVDSSPRVADIYDGTQWRTIVVGGLGKGGNSYYALDMTNADAADETQAAAKVLWEWSDPEVKYSYGRPVVVKVRDSGFPNGRWVVIVTGGYDNASGKGKIFFLDAATGALLSTVTTPDGSPPGAGQAAGLAQIHAFVKSQANQVAEQVYGGDLLGNVWRVDVSAVDSYKTASPVLFAKLLDSVGVPQPVTTAPRIEIDINNGTDRYLFIGTGRLLDVSDFTTPVPAQQQTMYAIRDGTIDTIATGGLPITRTDLKPILPAQVGAIAGGAPNGWYEDLPDTPPDAERIVVDPMAAVNIVSYVGTTVQDDPCVIALPAYLYGRDYTTGESLIESGGTIVWREAFPEGLVGLEVVGLIQADGTQYVGVIASTEVIGARSVKLVNKFSGVGNRISWKLLGGQ